MQQEKSVNGNGRVRGKKVGLFTRVEKECKAYIKVRVRQLGMSESQFIQNCIGIAGPDMPRQFKFLFNVDRKPKKWNGHRYVMEK